jgi:hypothetical protein
MSSFDHRLIVCQAGTLMTNDQRGAGIRTHGLDQIESDLLLTLANGQQRVGTTVSIVKSLRRGCLSAACRPCRPLPPFFTGMREKTYIVGWVWRVHAQR